MKVRIHSAVDEKKSRSLLAFLSNHHVNFEMASGAETTHLYHGGPAVEIDGRLFVDPNADALRKLLKVA